MPEPAGRRRRTFGPVVLAGLVFGGLTAVAGTKPVMAADPASPLVTYDAHLPLVAALGLVVLACWGVVLVTRGWVRRATALLGAVASAGALATVLLGWSQVSDRLADEVAAVGVRGSSVSATPWYALALLGALVSLAACAAAILLAPAWPEMGSRYDAPGAAAVPEKAPEEQSSLDLWKAMDEGRDPTARDPEHPE
ncbi:Trp biosynthesis-associated membrane protein [Nocardioides aquiterrae]|uniref:Trp biosynthesis-associated membrane protein n=1 Tax=Nocardioides aquiterrae TaxID=203799 RepID=A0ABP4F1J2_9ACTN